MTCEGERRYTLNLQRILANRKTDERNFTERTSTIPPAQRTSKGESIGRVTGIDAAKTMAEEAAAAASAEAAAEVISISFDELSSSPTSSLSLAAIQKAYSFEGIGILIVTDVPTLAEKRAALLPLARSFALLPEATKAAFESPKSYYSVGWSHGKEKLGGKENKPDLAKGSYYANPLDDELTSDKALIDKYPAFYLPNIWPSESLPSLEQVFKEMGALIHSVGVQVAKACDAYVTSEYAAIAAAAGKSSEQCAYSSSTLENVINKRFCKGKWFIHPCTLEIS
jgi:hypothetical protein